MFCLYNSPAPDSSLGGGVFYNYRMPIDIIWFCWAPVGPRARAGNQVTFDIIKL